MLHLNIHALHHWWCWSWFALTFQGHWPCPRLPLMSVNSIQVFFFFLLHRKNSLSELSLATVGHDVLDSSIQTENAAIVRTVVSIYVPNWSWRVERSHLKACNLNHRMIYWRKRKCFGWHFCGTNVSCASPLSHMCYLCVCVWPSSQSLS